ncbi:ABC transporter substrate-binding protein [Actinomycetospora endophytica]|uniref:ABC transporter substrate-binding protein n=1 Tax=Actinomycetospora endophytica TaxID=2291215 RepID=A0ABS8PFY7_9PSEU|nr:ABC transporter substrate-binding protein [Actinomycetospora endophytica]MCD2196837.1 ABC transporter substrate-binding protein [Actinomycetospora endophytica]
MSISRPRPMVVLAVVLSALALLAGCSSGTDQQAGGTGGTGGTGATISTAFGNVTAPANPTRVVALGWSDAETALALGVQAVGASDWLAVGGDGLGPWVTQRYTTPPQKLGTLEVDLEQVAALQPDLILDTRSSGSKERHDQLAQLGVPVVEIPAGGENYLTSWQDQLRMVGAALGKQQEAARLQGDLDGRFATARARNPQLNGATVVSGAKNTLGEYAAYVGRTGRVEFLRDLGLVNSPAIERIPSQSFSVPISREQMGLLDARVTIMQAISGNAADVTGDPLWGTVPSVAAGRGIVLDDKNVSLAFASSSVPGQMYALDRMVGPISAAVAKP